MDGRGARASSAGGGYDAPRARRPPQGTLLRAEPREPLELLLAHVSCTVLRAGCWLPVPPDWQLRGSVPPNYVALVCVGGAAEYTVGGATYRLQEGGLLLTPPQVLREGRHDPAHPLHLYSVHFHARLYGVLDMPAVYRLPVALRPAPEHWPRIVAIMQRIVEELAAADAGFVLAANAACAELVALLWRDAWRGTADASGRGNDAPDAAAANLRGGASARASAVAWAGTLPGRAADVTRLAPVFRTIETRYAEPLTLTDLARTVDLHPAYLSSVFRQAVGVPPLRYLGRFRLERARDLLVSTDLPIGAIAARTGFADPKYLDRVFRAAEGITPTAYRR
ncbi:MAG: AraC family transcriptional regulator, partial [Chloroflexota bacterium]|nr:AraC family transcriptional regulator [Chloroflexota bacterium]